MTKENKPLTWAGGKTLGVAMNKVTQSLSIQNNLCVSLCVCERVRWKLWRKMCISQEVERNKLTSVIKCSKQGIRDNNKVVKQWTDVILVDVNDQFGFCAHIPARTSERNLFLCEFCFVICTSIHIISCFLLCCSIHFSLQLLLSG